MRRPLALAALVAALASCHDGGPTPPCLYVECSGRGDCVEEGETVRCECDPGFVEVGLACLPEPGDAGPDAADGG